MCRQLIKRSELYQQQPVVTCSECLSVCSSFHQQMFVPRWIHACLCSSNYRWCISNIFCVRKKEKLRLVSFICKQEWHLGKFLFTKGVLSSGRKADCSWTQLQPPYRQAKHKGSVWITYLRRRTGCLPGLHHFCFSFLINKIKKFKIQSSIKEC